MRKALAAARRQCWPTASFHRWMPCRTEDVEEAWIKLAEQRFKQLESGEVQGIPWIELKKEIRGK
ncbi:MAG: addiction module protein [Flavobacteriales bacterium]|nr:addiction module protein [Flavobacteriales bacterium]